MTEPRNERSLSRIPFDPREERAIDGLARWMGVLGRFQVLAGGLLLLSVVGVAVAYGTTEALESPAQTSDTTPPLVRLGEVSLDVLLGIGAGVLVLGGIVVRGGVLLTDAAEDLEHTIHSDELDQHHVENALRRLRSYFRMELLLTTLVLAGALAWALPEWL